MDLHRTVESFEGFGPNPLDPASPRLTQQVTAKRLEDLRDRVRSECTKTAGVYGMLDRHQQLIYVGKSKQLRTRLLSYFSPRNAEEKGGRIIQTTRTIVWEQQPSEFAALVREQQLIRRWTPRWNVQEIPKRQRPVYLCLGRQPAAYFFLDKMPPADVVCSEGPFLGAARMHRAVDALNNHFKLRDCSSQQTLYFTDQLQLFELDHRPGCLRFEIKKCSGPCIGACSRNQYDQQIRAAQSFMNGLNDDPLAAVRQVMQQASVSRQYELAARMQCDLLSLEYLHRKLTFLADARRRFTCIYGVPGLDGRGIWYLIRQGEICESMLAPRDPDEFRIIRNRLQRWKRSMANLNDHQSASPYPYTLSLVAAWMRKHPEALEFTFQPHEAGHRYRAFAKATALAS